MKLLHIACIAFIATTLTACNDKNDKTFLLGYPKAAIINTLAPKYDDSDIELVNLVQGVYSGNLHSEQAGYTNVKSDYTVVSYGKYYYRIGRFDIDTVTKYSITNPNKAIYTYSTLDYPSEPSMNPQTLVFVSDTKAYLLRLGSPKIWIVNPSAEKESDFKMGEIDLSDYSDSDGSPEPSDGIIIGDKLFITLQRLDYWSLTPGNSWVAVIDTNTDSEITVDAGASFKGIHLQTNNPLSISYNTDAGLFVQSVGSYGSSNKYTGGLEKINLADYSTTVVLDDGNDTTHDYGQIADVALISDTVGYFIGYNDWQDNSLYQFNPTTGTVSAGHVASLNHVDIRNIVVGPEKSLWISIADLANPHVLVMDTSDNTVMDEISTTYNPDNIAFASQF